MIIDSFSVAPQPAKIAAALLALATLTACTGINLFGSSPPQPEATAAPPPTAATPSPPPPSPPPVDLAGRWRLSGAGTRFCFMNFGNAPGAAQGSIEPGGGCPENFFTSRKWTYEHGALIIRDHKDQPLAQLSLVGDRFEGKDSKGAALTLTR